jgi:hypothetical protein
MLGKVYGWHIKTVTKGGLLLCPQHGKSIGILTDMYGSTYSLQ